VKWEGESGEFSVTRTPPRRFAEQRGISKPGLLRALGMLKDFQRQAQGHFNANVFAPPGPGALR
jgi:hypothetical protein